MKLLEMSDDEVVQEFEKLQKKFTWKSRFYLIFSVFIGNIMATVVGWDEPIKAGLTLLLVTSVLGVFFGFIHLVDLILNSPTIEGAYNHVMKKREKENLENLEKA